MPEGYKKNIYYDTAEWALSKNDMWLRKSAGGWELMTPTVGVFHEISGEENIRQVFGIVPMASFEKDIAGFGYAPFCEIEASWKNTFLEDRSYVIKYLKNKKPDHYQVLVEAGIFDCEK